MNLPLPRFGRTVSLGKRKLCFSRVPRAEILIISSDTATEIAAHFPQRHVYVLDIESRTYFVRALISCFLRANFNFPGYIATVINQSGADLAISLQDNLLALFKVKPMLRRARIALVQNGQRSIDSDLEGEITQRGAAGLSVDYYFAFSEVYATRLRKLVDADIQVTGSFRSNYSLRHNHKELGVSYVSTFHPEVPRSLLIPSKSANEVVTYQMILDVRLSVLRAVADFCASHGIKLSIIGKRSNEQALEEENFYRSCSPDFDFTYYSRESYSSNYRLCDLSYVVVSTGSTLGYESLGRGNRTAIFCPDFRMLSDESLRFGWPLDIPEEGSFWSTSSSSGRVNEVLTHLIDVSDSEWAQSLAQFKSIIPALDQGNSVLVRTLSEFGARSTRTH